VRFATALLALAAAACASSSEPGAAERARLDAEARDAAARLEGAPPPADGELRVRLAFPDGDLDLYVTNAHSETIYFWNTPAKTGGALEHDARCEDPAPRSETVRIPAAGPGRYRIAVDYPKQCAGSLRVGFALLLEHGASRQSASGEIGPGEWLGHVLEFEIPEP
jgi:hypothetical protein